MKFSSIFALGACAIPAIATPLVGNAGGVVADVVASVEVPKILLDVDAIVALPIHEKRDAGHAIATPQDVIDKCNGLFVAIKIHTGAINNTASAVPAGTAPTEAHIATIKVHLNLIVDAVKAVVLVLGAVGGAIECTLEQVQLIVAIVVAIVLEIACTLLFVVKTLKLQLVLAAFIGNVAQILAALILVLEHLVGGVLKLVLSILNVPHLLQIVGAILGALLQCLASGNIHI